MRFKPQGREQSHPTVVIVLFFVVVIVVIVDRHRNGWRRRRPCSFCFGRALWSPSTRDNYSPTKNHRHSSIHQQCQTITPNVLEAFNRERERKEERETERQRERESKRGVFVLCRLICSGMNSLGPESWIHTCLNFILDLSRRFFFHQKNRKLILASFTVTGIGSSFPHHRIIFQCQKDRLHSISSRPYPAPDSYRIHSGPFLSQK